MQATADRGRPQANAGPGAILVPIGISLTLIGIIGDLFVHSLDPQGHANEELFVFGSGNNPWHLVLFAGIVLTTLGGIRWAGRLSNELGALVGAGLVLLLVATLILGGVSGWRARATGGAGHAHGLQQAARSHETTSSGAGGHTHDAGQAAIGEGAEGASNFGGHSHGQPASTTEQEWLVLGRQLATAKSATAKYKNMKRAKADGYFQVTQFIPGLGLHLANLGIRQDVFEPSRPQLLLYTPKRSGGYSLAGVGYTFVHDGDIPPAGFAGGQDVWHFHNNLCFLLTGSVTLTPDAAECQARGGVFEKQTAWLLHAWIWRTNPNGVFTESNPNVA